MSYRVEILEDGKWISVAGLTSLDFADAREYAREFRDLAETASRVVRN